MNSKDAAAEVSQKENTILERRRPPLLAAFFISAQHVYYLRTSENRAQKSISLLEGSGTHCLILHPNRQQVSPLGVQDDET